MVPPDIVEAVAEKALKNDEYEEWAQREVAKGRSLNGPVPIAPAGRSSFGSAGAMAQSLETPSGITRAKETISKARLMAAASDTSQIKTQGHSQRRRRPVC